MALHFELTGVKASGAAVPRTGRLVLDRASGKAGGAEQGPIVLETPGFFKYTRHGLQPHLVPDVAAEVDTLPAATRVQLEDFLETDSPDCGRYSEGLHKFLALDSSEILILDTLDPTIYARTAKPTNAYMAIDSDGGTRRLAAAAFAQLANSLKPDIVIPPFDVIEDPLPSLTQGKRISKSVARTAKWLDDCIAALTYPVAIFAPVAGSHSLELRTKAAESLVARQDIAGYAFNDVGLAVTQDYKLRLATHSLEKLDASKPRYMLGASAPDAVLRAVLGGIDLFDSSYPYAVTEQGFASTYVLGDSFSCTQPASETSVASATDAAHLDLWQESMFADFGPLVEGCACFTCRGHHRSYIHHLLKTKEMLATVLLQIHNLHWYQRFFNDIRASLAQGLLPADTEHFLKKYGCETPQTLGGCRPVQAFGELDALASQTLSPTTKIQRKRHAEQQPLETAAS
ncbi:hypothetical protein GGI02_004276 [Coemansia sp. RSA 2322]|uniref:Queuine tRNA-ribosyltransferase accessory subunit 2 n=1 Tax=Coemansia thaxteri TaxID=2663907 RepID=A0A9W8B9C6_9FUNG|nr:hypothetical protein H4R26_004508 [Coemansia thaxteri]KAJ2466732.1 hypothetical protein GGI02_004276 [Coemansia sp. RSA 2322]KAJ2484567.1 hypothetical protein EV174_002334 [Coemansia sp. RSA 2320]